MRVPPLTVGEAASLLQFAIRAFRDAMDAEHIPDATAQRVVNRVVWGDPEGYVPVRRPEDDDRIELPPAHLRARPWTDSETARFAGLGPVAPERPEPISRRVEPRHYHGTDKP